MAGFFRGVALIGAMAMFSPAHQESPTPSWTEGVTSARAGLESLAGGKGGDEAARLVSAAALAHGPDIARRLAELDPETRRVVLDMSLAAAARLVDQHGKPASAPR